MGPAGFVRRVCRLGQEEVDQGPLLVNGVEVNWSLSGLTGYPGCTDIRTETADQEVK
jgi:hypothetical protein